MISPNLTLNGKGHAFLIMYPQEAELSAETIESMLPQEVVPYTTVATGPWLYYDHGADAEELSAWEMPGAKILFNLTLSFDAAKQVADDLVAALKEKTGQPVNLVVLDQERLKEL